MNWTSRIRTILYTLWTLLSIGAALFILGDVLGDAAWNGINVAMGIYLLLSIAGVLGLVAGFRAAFYPKGRFALITCISALAIAGLSLLFGLSFLISRTPGVPLSDPMVIAGFSSPIILLYCAVFFICSVEAFLFFPRNRKQQAP